MVNLGNYAKLSFGEALLKIVSILVRGIYYDRPMPPDMKIKTVINNVTRYGTRVFIETGTYLGKTTEAVAPFVEKAYTIEVSEDLANKAKEKFKNVPNVTVIQGDSGIILKDIIRDINERCFFWLDSHYSGGITSKGKKETPIIEELETILTHKVKNHIIFVDDARCFNLSNYYPLADHLLRLIEEHGNNYKMILRNDIIRLLPR